MKKSPVENKNTEPSRNDRIAAQIAEILLSKVFSKLSSKEYDRLGPDNAEMYQEHRQNLDQHLGEFVASVLVKKGEFKITGEKVWEAQRKVVSSSLEGEKIGEFADLFYGMRPGGIPAEAEPEEAVPILPDGEPDIVRTNSRIKNVSDEESDPMIFLDDALQVIQQRKSVGGNKFIGPENYATALKYFSDKTLDQPLENDDIKNGEVSKIVNYTLSGFGEATNREDPNIIEITNVLSAIKNLPKGTIDARNSSMILQRSAHMLNEFSSRGAAVLVGTIGKMDVSQSPEEAAMVLDLAFRKGSRQERTGDMLSSLRALANLPHSTASERATSSFLYMRPSFELSGGLDQLEEVSRYLLTIVENVTENPQDTMSIKGIGNVIARRSSELFNDMNKSDLDTLQRSQLHEKLSKILELVSKI